MYSKINFKTPGGLKIRLNHRYFFCQLTKPDRYYTDEEIVNNDTMYNATANIESMFLTPTMLIQVFALFAIIFKLSIPVFCISSVALFLFGCIWRCSKQDFLLSTVLLFFATLYKMLWGAWYIALIILVFTLNCTYLIIPYIAIRFICFVVALLQNNLISNITHKKYGVPFNDTEICAFRFFHRLSESDLRLSDYIKLYVSVVHDEHPTTNEIQDTPKGEQISLFDTSAEFDEIMQSEPLSKDEREKLTEEMESTKFVTLNLLSPLNGYAQYPLEVTDENIELITKWLNKETNSVYCLEVFKQGEAQHYYTTKELFEDLKTKFEA